LKAYKAKLLQEYQESAYEVQEVTTQINSLEESVAKTVQKNKEDLNNYRSQTTKTLLDNLRTRYIQAQQQEQQILAAYNEQFNQAQGQEQAAVSIKLLEQDIETKKGFLKNLSEQEKENDIIAVGTDNNVSVAEIAIPPDRTDFAASFDDRDGGIVSFDFIRNGFGFIFRVSRRYDSHDRRNRKLSAAARAGGDSDD
jgi:hypothetical protein